MSSKAVPKFDITIQDGRRVFFNRNHVIKGDVVLEVVKPTKARGVFIDFRCYSDTYWSEGSGKNRRSYSQTVDIFNFPMTLWTPPNGEKKGKIPPGSYVFPFSFSFPTDCVLPPSFHGSAGGIYYVIIAKIDRPLRIDRTCQCVLSYIPSLDCNNRCFDNEVYLRRDKKMRHLFSSSEKINASVCIPSSAWCPGEFIPIAITVINESESDLKDVTCTLWSDTVFWAGASHTKRSVKWADASLGKIVPAKGEISDIIFVRVPSVCPTFSRDEGRIIENSYVMMVTVRLPKGHFDSRVKLPLTIGTIPHRTQPLFVEDMSHQSQLPVYSWADVGQIAGMALNSVQPETVSERELYYMYFDMPKPAVFSIPRRFEEEPSKVTQVCAPAYSDAPPAYPSAPYPSAPPSYYTPGGAPSYMSAVAPAYQSGATPGGTAVAPCVHREGVSLFAKRGDSSNVPVISIRTIGGAAGAGMFGVTKM